MQKAMPYIKWTIVVMLGLAGYYFTPTLEIAPNAPQFMALTACGVTILALELMTLESAVIVLSSLYILTGLAPPKAVLGPWTTGTVWIVFGSIIIGYFIIKTGLAKRIALAACVKLGGSYLAVMLGLVTAGFILGPVISSAIGKAVILSAIAVGCCQALNFEQQSKEATGLLLAGFFGAAAAHFAFLTGGADTIMAIGFYREKMPDHTITWIEYFIHNFPISFVLTMIGVFSAFFLLRPKGKIDSEALRRQFKELPVMSTDEKKAAALLLFTMTIFLTEGIHGLNINFLVMFMSGLLFLPRLNMLSKADYPKINLWMVVFVAGCMGIGSTAIATGVDKWLAQSIAPTLEGSGLAMIMKVYVAGILINFVLTPLAACSAMMVPLIEIMNNLGFNPLVGIYTFLLGLDQYIFPYEIAILLFFFASGYMSMKWLILSLLLRMGISIVAMAMVAYPYWHFIGLI